MRSKLKKILTYIFNYSGALCIIRLFQRGPIVLFWHGVSAGKGTAIEGESFSKDLFERQIQYITKHYEVISLNEYYSRYLSNSFTNREVVITFDDGYKNNLYVAAPILKKYSLPFTIFVSALNVEEQKRFYVAMPRLIIVGGQLEHLVIPSLNIDRYLSNDKERMEAAANIENQIKYLSHEEANIVADELRKLIDEKEYRKLCELFPDGSLLTWDELRNLVNEYDCTIGSHTLDHCVCHENQDKQTIENQILRSKELIEHRLHQVCNFFAYPNGDFSAYSNTIVENNYLMGFSTQKSRMLPPAKSVACMGRMGVPNSYDNFMLHIALSKAGMHNNTNIK